MSNKVSKILLDRGGVHTTNRGSALTVNQEDLIAFYPMEEQKGRVIVDETKNGNDGWVYGATRTNGRAGQGLKFGKRSFVEISSKMSMDFGLDNLSYCFFITPEDDGKVFHKYNGRKGYELRIENKRIRAAFEGDNGRTELSSNKPITFGDEYHICVYRDGGMGHLIVNNAQEDLRAAEYDLRNTEPLLFGDKSRQGFSGKLDEVYVYRRALSRKEIQNQYEKYVGPP